jgi:hypothetical protein
MKKLDKAILSFVDRHYILCGITGQLIAAAAVSTLTDQLHSRALPITLPILIIQIIAAIYLGRVIIKYIKNA